ncbi:WD40-repeat-containing domain protein, partial [Scheffersomyces amazonensis]|uniref:WD40-repeat-containing domain protein n=1 Tax=Scheffersomyces amazonensis TaxID=1078765 RepID=UPI00315C725C
MDTERGRGMPGSVSQLKISELVGTSARTAHQIAIGDNNIAYIVSGGVVVSHIGNINVNNNSETTVLSQRFFCANSSSGGDSRAVSSANAYLNKALSDMSLEYNGDIKKDSYGYPINGDPTIYNGIGGITNNDPFKSSSSGLDDTDSTSTSPSKLKDRVRSINCIALSPDQRILAVGEAGYQPRILLFSLAPNSSGNPFALIYEHTFAVNCLVFSPDSKYLCSLGSINDGFIHVWKLTTSSIALQATNRCSTIINQLIWCNDYIVTLGLRVIKVWKFQEEDFHDIVSKPNALKGKNVILGPYINANFIDSSVLNNDELLLITTENQLLLLKIGQDNSMNFDLKLISLESPQFEFNSIEIDNDSESIWLGNDQRKFEFITVDSLTVVDSPRVVSSNRTSSPSKEITQTKNILKLSKFTNNNMIYLSKTGDIVLVNNQKQEKPLVTSLVKDLGGIKSCFSKEFMIFSKDGEIKRLLNLGGLETVMKFQLPSFELSSNSLTAIESFTNHMVVGDKYGHLFIIELNEDGTQTTIFKTKAHTSSINEIIYFEINEYQIISTISRDRMIQIFYKAKQPSPNNWDLLQTIAVHNGNVLKIQYYANKLYTCSSDRTVAIHRFETESILQLVQEKILTLKASPTTLKLYDNDLIVSTTDRCLQIYDINESYELKRSLKLFNDRNNESLLVENFINFKNMIIVSSSDKSLRMFNYLSGRSICSCWGHSDSILSLVMRNDNELVSIGTDGCLFIWKVNETCNDLNVADIPPTSDIDETKSVIDPFEIKVTRKIIPTVPLRSSTPSPERRELSSADSSPTPRLTAATLKRLSTKGSAPLSRPPPPQSPTRSHTRNSASITAIPLSPSRTPKSVPVRTQRHSIDLTLSPGKSPKQISYTSPSKSLATSLSMVSDPKVFVDKALFQLSHMESRLKQENHGIDEEGKLQLKSKLTNILTLLGDGDKLLDQPVITYEQELLEKYSHQLVEMVQEKLSHHQRSTSSTPSND